MLKLLGLTIVQSFLLMLSQVFLKLAVTQIGSFQLNYAYIKGVLMNYHLAISGITVGAAMMLWVYILKHFPFSLAYPLGSISYVFGLLAAVVVFHEDVSLSRWIGVGIIIIGIYFVSQ